MTSNFLITQEQQDLWFETLQSKVREILTTPSNLLGVLEFSLDTNKTIPAIYIKAKELSLNKWRMRADSGILCIIHNALQIKPEPLMGSQGLIAEFKIELVQYNRNLTNNEAVIRLTTNNYLDIYKAPITTPQMELPSGVAYERTIITVIASKWGLKTLV